MQTTHSWYELASGYCFHRQIWPNIYVCFTQRGNKNPQTKALVKGVFVQQHSWSAPRYPHPALPLGAVPPHLQLELGLRWRVDLQAPPDIPAELWHWQGADRTGQRGTTGQPKLVFILPARSVAGAGLKWREANEHILEDLPCELINTPLIKSTLYNVKGLKWSGKYSAGTQS